MDCAEIWYVVRDPLTRRFTEVNGGIQVHVRTCDCASPFRISRTAGPIGTGEASFDAPERRKDDGAKCGAIGATCQHANPCKNLLSRLLGLTKGPIGLKLCGTMATIGGQNPLGKQ